VRLIGAPMSSVSSIALPVVSAAFKGWATIRSTAAPKADERLAAMAARYAGRSGVQTGIRTVWSIHPEV
jgi:hypothetical protein